MGSAEMPKRSSLDAARDATSEELLRELQKEDYLAKLLQDTDGDLTVPDSSVNIRLAGNRSATLSVHKAADLSSESRDAIFQLFESNMKEKYLKSKNGYAPEEKREELFNDESRIILVRDPSSQSVVGFTSFRFDTEDTADDDVQVEVVYCYEVQVSSELRGAGLGRLLMRCLETFARSYSLAKVMLTVFEANTEARTFYKRLNYESDEICPSNYEYDQEEGQPDYRILSCSIRARSSRNKKKKKKSAS